MGRKVGPGQALMATKDPLEAFHELQDNDDQGATSLADEALGEIAKTGRVHHTWNNLKPVLIFKLKKNLKLAFSDLGPSESENVDHHQELLERLSGFSNPPFTIQRLCELLAFPCKHYNRTDKYLRALERVLMVVTYVEPELCVEGRVPPATSVPTEELIGVGGGESVECTTPSGELEDSRGERKRELAMVELQEADSTVEGAEDDAAVPTKKAKWEQRHNMAATTEQVTERGTSTEVLPGSGSPVALQEGGSPMAVQEGGSPMTLQGGGSPTALQGGGSIAALQGGGSPTALQGGGSPTALQGGGSPTALQGGRSPTALQDDDAMETSDGSGSPCETADLERTDPGPGRQEGSSQGREEGPASVTQVDRDPDDD